VSCPVTVLGISIGISERRTTHTELPAPVRKVTAIDELVATGANPMRMPLLVKRPPHSHVDGEPNGRTLFPA
jgi:hypothetical protein